MSTLVYLSRPRIIFWGCPLKSRPVHWSLGSYYWFSSDSPGRSRDTWQGKHKFSKNSRSHFKVLGAGRVTRSKFHTEDAQTLGATVQNLVPGMPCFSGLDLPQSGHYLFLPNILQFTAHHWRSEVWHTDRVLKHDAKTRNDKMYNFCVKAVCTRRCRLKYAFIFFFLFIAIGA